MYLHDVYDIMIMMSVHTRRRRLRERVSPRSARRPPLCARRSSRRVYIAGDGDRTRRDERTQFVIGRTLMCLPY